MLQQFTAEGGSLTGYAGGMDRKVRLLELEHTDITGLFMPKEKRSTLRAADVHLRSHAGRNDGKNGYSSQ